MSASYRIEGYAIASADGMIADGAAVMPDALKIEADHVFLKRELDRVDAVVHGRRSHEGHPNSRSRRRLVLTHRIAGIARDPGQTQSLLWNPAGASFDDACRELGLAAGTIAILGGTHVYGLFLDIGYDAFHLCRAGKARIPGGTPVFADVAAGRSPEQVLADVGLAPGPTQILDPANSLSLVSWRRPSAA
ncbi:MAG: dihydrofolate reductase [Roseiarcus sp.]|jgi:dihydrofolate reductase